MRPCRTRATKRSTTQAVLVRRACIRIDHSMWASLHRSRFRAGLDQDTPLRWRSPWRGVVSCTDGHCRAPRRQCTGETLPSHEYPGCRANTEPWGALATRTVSSQPRASHCDFMNGTRTETSTSFSARLRPRRPGLWLALLTVLAAWLRIAGVNKGLWWDEIYFLTISVRHPLAEILTTFPGDTQHPLYSVLARLSILAFGEHAWTARTEAPPGPVARHPTRLRRREARAPLPG